MTLRRCPGIAPVRCAKLTENSHCDEHLREIERVRLAAKRARRPYTAQERQARAAVVRAWVAQHGEMCPGWRTPQHPITEWTGPLSADHLVAVARGGDEAGPMAPLCRWCNSRKGKSSN